MIIHNFTILASRLRWTSFSKRTSPTFGVRTDGSKLAAIRFEKTFGKVKMRKNITLKVVVSEVKPFIFILNGKIIISIKEFQSILDMFPKEANLQIVSYKQFEVGSINETGHYNGLIVSSLDRPWRPAD